jgi:beta-mannosidase
MDLGGAWRAAEADDTLRRQFPDPELVDDDWTEIQVPGHWRSTPAFEHSDGPLFYRRRFETLAPETSTSTSGTRRWLDFDGIFYQGDVWLDGSYLGDTEGYFVPHSFEVTEALAAGSEHILAVEATCAPPSDRTAKRNLTGIFQHWDCIDPSWNPGGIWAPVRVTDTGPVRIRALKILCREATEDRAILDIQADLDALDATAATLTTSVTLAATVGLHPGPSADAEPLVTKTAEERLAGGRNRVRWRVTVERPQLWWPHSLGDQPLHEVAVTVAIGGEPSDERRALTGLRQIRMRNFVATVNGERLFLKGANLGPVRRELAEATPAECETDVRLARDAGLDLLRIHAHVSRPELYDAADRAGMLLWQDLPLQWGYGNVRRQAVSQARQAVRLLGHHPSIALWCGHNEPFALDIPPGGTVEGSVVRQFVAGQFLPGFNKTVLDRSIKRTLERADRSRPVVSHSGVLPHPSGGTDTHLYCGWYHSDERDFPSILARLPILARFVSEFGAQAVPETAAWMHPEDWPHLDWARLGASHALQKDVFDRRVPPAEHASFEEWRRATQDYQSTVIRHHVETLRRLKYRPTGGFCQFLLADAQPAVSWSVLDHHRVPKAGYQALAEACAPVIVVAERPAARYRAGERVRLALHVVSDLRQAVDDATTTAVLRWPGGERTWRFGGDIPADSCVRVGQVDLVLPADAVPGDVTLDLSLRWSDPFRPGRAGSGPGEASGAGHARNRYQSRLER